MADMLVYGAYGYTGDLIAREAVDRGLDVIVAGRDRNAVENQALKLNSEERVVGLDEPKLIDLALEEVPVVLNCAGPFVDTYRPMAEACLRTGTHYLDITGEIDVFEALAGRGEEARDADVMILPGTGFDVVPTDCLAAHLAGRLPEATQLRLGFEASGGLSPGTAKTAIRSLGEGGAIRRESRIESVPAAWQTRQIDFGNGERTAVSVPWGDVATAYHTTGIPNVAVYAAVPSAAAMAMHAGRILGPVLGAQPVRSMLESLVDLTVDGPDETTLATGRTYVWGEVETADGERAVSRLTGPEAYRLTTLAALAIVERVLDGDAPLGYQTPAGAYGADLILDVEGVERTDEPIDARSTDS